MSVFQTFVCFSAGTGQTGNKIKCASCFYLEVLGQTGNKITFHCVFIQVLLLGQRGNKVTFLSCFYLGIMSNREQDHIPIMFLVSYQVKQGTGSHSHHVFTQVLGQTENKMKCASCFYLGIRSNRELVKQGTGSHSHHVFTQVLGQSVLALWSPDPTKLFSLARFGPGSQSCGGFHFQCCIQ